MSDSEKKKERAENPQVVEVIPILKGLPKPALTYFSLTGVREGEFVHITVRGIPTVALVTRVEDAREAKSGLRTGAFALKKLSGKSTNLGISRSLTLAVERTAAFYAATTGSVLGAIIPKLFLTEPELLTFNFPETLRTPREPMLIQLESEERFATYKSIIRENFARSNSTIFIAPTNELARRAFASLSSGIEDYAYLFTLDDKKKTLHETLKLARANMHPILFVTTPAGLIFDRPDLATIILEHENTRGYTTRSDPYFSMKTLIEFYARASGKALIIGDTVLSIETLWREKQGMLEEFVPLKWRATAASSTSLVDMKRLKDETGRFEILSEEVKTLITASLNEGEKIFLFGARKGLAPSTVCGDCGSLLPCSNCGAPVVLHKKTADERIYVCHACGATRPSETRCDTCSSWKLVPLGIGIDRIADEVRALWPEVPIYIFDKDHVETAAQARNLAKKIGGDGPAIIIGTELYTLYTDTVRRCAVISLDSLFAIPDFGIHERIFSLITKLREMTEKELIIQTRNIGKDVITQAAKGDTSGFYRSEIEDRQAFMYPPFSIFVKASAELRDADVSKEAFKLKNLFSTWNPEFMKVRGKKAGLSVITMIIRMRREEWPDRDIVQKLSLLGSDFIVKVDPESIL